ncbi:MAG: M16 family metallopeptidase [Candidatus Zipacnadales bacterium]
MVLTRLGVVFSTLAVALAIDTDALAAPVITSLDNGLKVCVVEDTSSDIVAVQVVLHVPADCEPNEKAGLRTLVQHTIRATWDKRIESADDLVFLRDMHDIRGGLYINTDWEYTALGYSGVSETLAQALAFLGPSIFAPELTEEAYTAASDIVRSTAQGPQNTPAESTIALFRLSLTGQTTRAYPVGTPETIEHITFSDVKAFHRRFYIPNLTTICVVGPTPVEQVQRLVAQHFGSFVAGDMQLPEPPPIATEPQVRVKTNPRLSLGPNNMQVASLVVGVPAPGLGDPDEAVAYIIHGLLGANGLGGGRLERDEELWGELGLPFSAELARKNQLIESLPPPTSRRAHIAIHAYVAPRQAEHVRQELVGQFEEFARNEPTPEELERAKEYVIGSFATLFDTPMNRALLLGRAVALGVEDQQLASKWCDRIARITPQDVARVARQYFPIHGVGIELPEYSE